MAATKSVAEQPARVRTARARNGETCGVSDSLVELAQPHAVASLGSTGSRRGAGSMPSTRALTGVLYLALWVYNRKL